MDFNFLREKYGKNLFSRKNLMLRSQRKSGKIMSYLFLNYLVCLSFGKINNSSIIFKFYFRNAFFNTSSCLLKTFWKLKKVWDFFLTMDFWDNGKTFLILKIFFKNLLYELDLIILTLKKGIFQGWVSISTIKFYLFPFFKQIEFFFYFVSKFSNTPESFKGDLSWYRKLKTSNLFSRFKKAYHFYLGKLLIKNYGFKNQNSVAWKWNFFFKNNLTSIFDPNKKSFYRTTNFSGNRSDNFLKFYLLSLRILKNFPGWEKWFLIQKQENLKISAISGKKPGFLIFSVRFFLLTSQFALKMTKKSINVKKIFSKFSDFLFYKWAKIFSELFVYSSGYFEITRQDFLKEKFSLKKNQFGFFYFRLKNPEPEKNLKIFQKNFKPKEIFLPQFKIFSWSFKSIFILRWPYSMFITQNSAHKYQILLKVFFHLKSQERSILLIWKNQVSLRNKKNPFQISIMVKLTYQILCFLKIFSIHLLDQLFAQNYLENDERPAFGCNLHRLVFFHENFTSQCLNRIFLGSPVSYKFFLRILTTSSLFRFFVQKREKKWKFFPIKARSFLKIKAKKEKIFFDQNLAKGIKIFIVNFEKNLRNFLTENKRKDSLKISFQKIEKMLNFNHYY